VPFNDCHANEVVDRVSRRKSAAATFSQTVDAERPYIELADHPAHATNVIAVRMRHDGEVDRAGAVVALHMVDKRFPVLLEAGVDDHVRETTGVRAREAQRDRVSVTTALADGKEVDSVHLD